MSFGQNMIGLEVRYWDHLTKVYEVERKHYKTQYKTWEEIRFLVHVKGEWRWVDARFCIPV